MDLQNLTQEQIFSIIQALSPEQINEILGQGIVGSFRNTIIQLILV